MRAVLAVSFFLFGALAALADTFKIATYNTELSQDGPGLLLRALETRRLPQVEAVLATLAAADADILILQGIDWDLEHAALTALTTRLSELGMDSPFTFSREPNSGSATALDMNGDGKRATAADTQSYGAFRGAHGLAVLSRFPLQTEEARDLSTLLWHELPDANLPTHADDTPFPSREAQSIQRLSSTNHWILPVKISEASQINLVVFHATPPVFDGPEDRNGKRNRDELLLLQKILDGSYPPPIDGPIILVGDANLDPDKGAGQKQAIRELLAHPRLQDTRPHGEIHQNATVNWQQTGPMRVDYVLPETSLETVRSAVLWPKDQTHPAHSASRHYLVWVEIVIP